MEQHDEVVALADIDDTAMGWAVKMHGGKVLQGDGLNIDDIRYLLRRVPAFNIWLGTPGNMTAEQIKNLPNGSQIIAEVVTCACGYRPPEPLDPKAPALTEEERERRDSQQDRFDTAMAKALKLNAITQVDLMLAIMKVSIGEDENAARPFVLKLASLVAATDLSDPPPANEEGAASSPVRLNKSEPSISADVTWSAPPPRATPRRKPSPISGAPTKPIDEVRLETS